MLNRAFGDGLPVWLAFFFLAIAAQSANCGGHGAVSESDSAVPPDSAWDAGAPDAGDGGAWADSEMEGDADTDGGTHPTQCSQYLVEVNPPAYDPNDPEHFLIRTQEDWSHVNDPDKRVFYVAPNEDYGTVVITSSGTADKPRYLLLYEPSGLHPAKLPRDQQANVQLVFDGVSHWIVSRLSGLDRPEEVMVQINPPSHDIVLDRLHLAQFFTAVQVNGTSDASETTRNITIQRCRIGPMSMYGIDHDAVAVFLKGTPSHEPYLLYDTHILENEIFNSNDGIQLIRHPDYEDHHPVDYAGTVIDCNHIYVTPDLYTDGNGNLDPNGLWALTENAIDLKGGSEDPSNPVIVSNNFMWGYRRTDTNGGGSGSWGAALIGHYDVKNIELFGNVVFDSNRGIAFGAPRGLPYSAENVSLHDNILYDIGYDTDGGIQYCHYFYHSNTLLYEHNTIVGVDKHSYWFANFGDEIGLEVRCNAIIDSAPEKGDRANGTVVSDNYFYNTEPKEPGDGTTYPTAADAHMADLVFTTDRYTNHPRQITLPGVVTTASSPHAGWCAP